MSVTETFFSLEVGDMQRARKFYVEALGATVSFESPSWSSLHIAGVRIGLFAGEGSGGRTGVHFAVTHLGEALKAVEVAGGRVIAQPTEVGVGVVIAKAEDPEGNIFTLRGP